jgi:hypothetical protein
MRALWEAADFVRRVRRQLRFGELSRAPLRLLRLELRGEFAECEWMARGPDPWDAHLAPSIAQRNQTFQALRDAIAVRELMFNMISELQSAKLRVYRQSASATDLIITGLVTREDRPPLRVSSIVMQAKLCGLHFTLEDGVLGALPMKEHNLRLAML